MDFIKKNFFRIFTELFVMTDKMIDREFIPSCDYIDDTYLSQIYHQMSRLYGMLQG